MMLLNGNKVPKEDLPEAFAIHFSQKIDDIISAANICPNVYNGQNKITVGEIKFMTPDKVLEAIKGLKMKNSEGPDRIPQRILIYGMELLCESFTVLMIKICKSTFLN